MPDCIFCRIAQGDIPASIVERNSEMIAFRDIQPHAPTHVLVIPAQHLESVRDAAGAEGEALLGRMLAFTARVATTVARVFITCTCTCLVAASCTGHRARRRSLVSRSSRG